MKAGKNKQVVERLIDAVNDNDQDRIQSFFSQNMVFHGHNQCKESVGRDAVWKKLGELHGRAEEVEWTIDRLEEDGQDVVMADGSIRYLVDGAWQVFSTCGSFEVKGSKITQWVG